MYGGYGHPHGRGCGCEFGYGIRGGGSGVRLRQRYRDCFYYSQPVVSPDIRREALEAEKLSLKIDLILSPWRWIIYLNQIPAKTKRLSSIENKGI